MVRYGVTVTLSMDQRSTLPGMNFTLGVRKGLNGTSPEAIEWLRIPIEGEKIEFGWDESLEVFETRTVMQVGVPIKQTDRFPTMPGDVLTYTTEGGFIRGAPAAFAGIPVDQHSITVYNLSNRNLKIGIMQGAEVNGVKTTASFTIADVLANTGVVTFNLSEQITLVWSTSYQQNGVVGANSSTAPYIDTLTPAEPNLELTWDGSWTKNSVGKPNAIANPTPATCVALPAVKKEATTLPNSNGAFGIVPPPASYGIVNGVANGITGAVNTVVGGVTPLAYGINAAAANVANKIGTVAQLPVGIVPAGIIPGNAVNYVGANGGTFSGTFTSFP